MCTGDCDSSSDDLDGLICSNVGANPTTIINILGLCKGDCDSSSNCLDSLVYFQIEIQMVIIYLDTVVFLS